MVQHFGLAISLRNSGGTTLETVSNMNWGLILSFILLLEIAGITCQDDEEEMEDGWCQETEFSLDDTPCSDEATEIYRDEDYGQSMRLCCQTGTKAEMSAFASATTCRSTKCHSTTAFDLCSTLTRRYVNDSEIIYEEVFRDTCTLRRPGDREGIAALCCPQNSQEGVLLTTYGAEKHEFPHIAHLSMGCGSTIYNKNFVITAAHCVVADDGSVKDPSAVTVTMGTNIGDLDSQDHVYQADWIFTHKHYSGLANHSEMKKKPDDRRAFNDIALIRVDRNITFGPYVKSLEMAHKGFRADEYASNAVIAGWGTTDNLASTTHLQKANFIIRSDRSCFSGRWSEKWGIMKGLEDQLLCVGGVMDGKFSPTAGGGDSGGPAICRNRRGYPVLCGVTSFGGSDEKCAAYKNETYCPPSVYAEVQHFRDWITGIAGDQDRKTFYRPYLYGGPVTKTDYPHQVHITSSAGKTCGGTLVAKDVVITAAQCVTRRDRSERFLDVHVTPGLRTLGESKRSKSIQMKAFKILKGFERVGKPVNVKAQRDRVKMTDNYYKNDLAVIKLVREVDIEEGALPTIPSFGEMPTERAHEVAFPRNTTYSDKLAQREFRMLDRADCQTRMNRLQITGLNVTVDSNILCGVEKYSGGSQCDRELGGGLICKGDDGMDILCGVQVFRLCEWSIPNGFLNVGLYKTWIGNVMKGFK